MLEKTLESPLDSKKIKLVNPKGNQLWTFTGRTDAEAETPILWPPDVKSWLTVKDPDAAKDWGQETKGTTEDEMVGWHHGLSGHDWANSGRWWRTGKPGILQSRRVQRVRCDWVTEQQKLSNSTSKRFLPILYAILNFSSHCHFLEFIILSTFSWNKAIVSYTSPCLYWWWLVI